MRVEKHGSLAAAILAGGRSSRMGTDKCFVLLGGKPLIQHVIDRLALLSCPTMLIANYIPRFAQFGLPVFSDIIQGKGPLGGLYTALSYSHSDYTLCTACDMPFLNPMLLRYLVELSRDWEAVVPRIEGRPQGLHAIYHKSCLPVIYQQIAGGQLKIGALFDKVQVRFVDDDELRQFDPALSSFVNLNTPQDLRAIGKISPGQAPSFP